ncbi:MAG: threonine--tRNA ligase [Candidatus Omnitrophica bacterium]|nr:threonine--tRNA ligase [Candidatus Omnitrophota bacterium]
MDDKNLEILRHTTSHILAQAVKELYPDAKIAIGPAIENGFYYDFDKNGGFTPDDLVILEKRMKEIISRDLKLVREEIGKKEAEKLFQGLGENYKVELIKEIPDEKVTVYRQGEFIDLCRGPHLPSTGEVRAFKLTSLAGAYWRGSEKNPMLSRIYGTAFVTQKELDEYLHRLEEAERRDHRKLGKELELFSVSEDIGTGLVLWHPKGAAIRKTIEDYWRERHLSNGYELLYSPHIARLNLWKTSGHLDFYQDYMYAPMEIDEEKYQLKPMNCPFHIAIYKSRLRSYRELPLRWAELGTVYRYERSGVLHGLMRVRGFTQDDAHIFCMPEQIEGEILRILGLTVEMLSALGFKEYEVYLSTRPDDFVGAEENWERATAALEYALKKKGLAFKIDPGEGVFYGPKIDLKIKDVLGRAWQCTTIQVDFNLPERFGITYAGEDGKEHQPIMIHRALLGSLERFFGVLVEHYAGAFPAWLAPVQAVVMNITDAQGDYARRVFEALKKEGLRVELDIRGEKIGAKIRDAQINKVPYMLIIGKREEEKSLVAVRSRAKGDEGAIELNGFIDRIKEEIKERGN